MQLQDYQVPSQAADAHAAHVSCAAASSWPLACREPYAKILGIGTNNDGYTDKGITFPSGEAQRELGTSVSRAFCGHMHLHCSCHFSRRQQSPFKADGFLWLRAQVCTTNKISRSDITYVEAHWKQR